MKLLKQILFTIIFCLMAQIALAGVAADVFVKAIADDVLAIVKKDKEIQAGDQQKVFTLAEEKILPHFNFEHVCRLVLGKNYVKANKEQQDAFQKEFRTLMLYTYASALSKYRNQTIEYKPLKDYADDKQVVVKTLILQSGGQPIGVDYTLESINDSWKVYDISIEGVSLVTNYRSQFGNEIRQGSIDSLIQKLADKNKENLVAKK